MVTVLTLIGVCLLTSFLISELFERIEDNKEFFQNKFKDNNLRSRARHFFHFDAEINPIICKILTEERIPKEKGAEILGRTPEEITAFMEEMPTSFCSFALTKRRDEQNIFSGSRT